VLAGGDAQIQSALSLFPQAAALLSRRRSLQTTPEVKTADTLRN
jgi:hypothetical protein